MAAFKRKGDWSSGSGSDKQRFKAEEKTLSDIIKMPIPDFNAAGAEAFYRACKTFRVPGDRAQAFDWRTIESMGANAPDLDVGFVMSIGLPVAWMLATESLGGAAAGLWTLQLTFMLEDGSVSTANASSHIGIDIGPVAVLTRFAYALAICYAFKMTIVEPKDGTPKAKLMSWALLPCK